VRARTRAPTPATTERMTSAAKALPLAAERGWPVGLGRRVVALMCELHRVLVLMLVGARRSLGALLLAATLLLLLLLLLLRLAPHHRRTATATAPHSISPPPPSAQIRHFFLRSKVRAQHSSRNALGSSCSSKGGPRLLCLSTSTPLRFSHSCLH
jgi:hypothetical protein